MKSPAGIIETLIGAPNARRELLLASAHAVQLVSALGESRIAAAVRAARSVDDVAARSRLRDVFAAIETGDARAAAEPLYQLGEYLRTLGEFLAAGDTLEMAMQAAGPNHALFLQSALRCSLSWRMARKLDRAEDVYRILATHGTELADTRMQLEGELGLGRLLSDRSNYPAAEVAIAAVIAEARRSGELEILGRALTGAARIAGVRLQPARAIELSQEAIAYLPDVAQQEHVLLNIAVAQREIGNARLSRRIAEHLTRSGVEIHPRMSAYILLYDLAVDAGRRLRPYAEALDRMPLTPLLQAEYCEAVARGHAMRGDFTTASAQAARLRELATEHSLAEMETRAERALADLERCVVPVIYEFRPTIPDPATKHSLRAANASLSRLCSV